MARSLSTMCPESVVNQIWRRSSSLLMKLGFFHPFLICFHSWLCLSLFPLSQYSSCPVGLTLQDKIALYLLVWTTSRCYTTQKGGKFPNCIAFENKITYFHIRFSTFRTLQKSYFDTNIAHFLFAFLYQVVTHSFLSGSRKYFSFVSEF